MKKVFIITLGCFVAFSLHAQRFHLNALGGISNYGGDLQSKAFTFKQSNAAVALGMSYELSQKLYVRSEYFLTRLGADDALSNDKYFQLRRNLNFKTVLQELTLVAEYDILNNYEHQLVPYVFAGIGIYRFSPYTYDSTGTKVFLHGVNTEGQGLSAYPDRAVYKKTQLNIPMGAGVKLALSDNIRVAAEFDFRKLFTDYLDDVSTNYPDLALLSPAGADLSYRGDELKPPIPFQGGGAQRGNPDIKDNYYYLMFRISYRLPFGKGSYDNKHSGKDHRGCPPVKL
jgi:opacity protein-like surface antigen